MRSIHLTYRAKFRQPIGVLNPLGAKLSIPIDVEVFEDRAASWKLRRPGTRSVFEPVPASASAAEAKTQATIHFQEQLTGWQAFNGQEPLLPGEYIVKNSGKVFQLEPDDFTHVQHASKESDRRAALAACGGRFAFGKFASLQTGPPPTCKVCAAMAELMKKEAAV